MNLARAIGVIAALGGGTAAYGQLSGFTDDVGSLRGQAMAIDQNGASFSGTIDAPYDRDVFTLVALPFRTYRLRMIPDATHPPEGVECRVMDQVGTMLGRDVAHAGATATVQILEVPYLQRLYLDLRSFAEVSTGAYQLVFEPEPYPDHDNDLLPDPFEVQAGLSTNSTSPFAIDGAFGDYDGDGINNISEMWTGTSAVDAGDRLALSGMDPLSNGHRFEWRGVPGGWYRIEGRVDPDGNDWQTLGVGGNTNGNAIATLDIRGIPLGEYHQFRIISEVQPLP